MAVVVSKLTRKVRMNLQEKLGIPQETKGSKYHNVKVRLDGYLFDSIRERDRYLQLLMRQKMGEISGLTVHPRFPLVIKGEHVATYVGDFSYYIQHSDIKGVFVVEDVKGVKTAIYKLKKKLMKSVCGIKICEI